MTRDERQNLAIERWKASGCRATCVACTGLGKTRIALKCIDRLSAKNKNMSVVIVVPTRALKKQWQEEILKYPFTNSFNYKIQVLNTASKTKQECDFLIIDECHCVSSNNGVNIFKNCKYKIILGLTATFERLDQREKLIFEKLCPVCDTITLEEATENNWVAYQKHYKVLLDVDLTEYNKANQSFIQHFSFFNFDFNLALKLLGDKVAQAKYAKLTNTSLSEVSAHVYGWNKALQFRKSFIANHPKKLEVAKKIIEHRKDKKIITFNSSIQMCKQYKSGYIVSSKQSKKENEEIIKEFNSKTSGVLHSSKMCEAGIDIKGLSVGINVGFTSSKLSSIQKQGRSSRFEEGKNAEFFTLILRGTIDEKWDKKASEQQQFIIINEKELDLILSNKILNKTIQTGSEYNGMRY